MGRDTSTKSSGFSQCTIETILPVERTVIINEEKEEQEMVSVCSSCSQATEVKRKSLLADKKGDVTELEMISVQI